MPADAASERVAPLSLGGVPARALAEAYGTPLLVVDTDVLDARIAAYGALAETLGIDVAYAAKAFLCVALAERLAATPLGLDVCSLGELVVAERAGFPARRITFHGCGKTDGELAAALAGRVGRIVVDHDAELDALATAPAAAAPLATFVRVNAGVEADTHAFVRTAGRATKFGFLPEEADAAARRIAAAPALRFAGFHTHLGSQIFDEEPYAGALGVLLERCAEASRSGTPAAEAILGGGFGVDPVPGALQPDVAGIAGRLVQRCARDAAALGISAPRLGLEPGRSLVAEAGTSLYAVVAVKERDGRRFLILDGGLADNPRPALYNAYHHPQAVDAMEGGDVTTVVCGRSCENDQLVTADLPRALAPGALLALRTAGAYTFSMASNYNRFGRPAVVFAGGGTHRLAVRRETPDDLMRTDCGA